MHKIKIYTDNDESFIPTHVEIGNNEIHEVAGITYSQYAGEVPQCTIETRGIPDIDTLADIQFQFTPQTIQEATTVIRHNLLADKELFKAFVASIKSAFDDYGSEWDCADVNDLSKAIADRIIGKE